MKKWKNRRDKGIGRPSSDEMKFLLRLEEIRENVERKRKLVKGLLEKAEQMVEKGKLYEARSCIKVARELEADILLFEAEQVGVEKPKEKAAERHPEQKGGLFDGLGEEDETAEEGEVDEAWEKDQRRIRKMVSGRIRKPDLSEGRIQDEMGIE